MDTKYLEEDKAMSAEIAAEFGEGWLPPVPTVEIDRPIAFPGNPVVFHNYRAIRNNPQLGKVVHVETAWNDEGEYSHVYQVRPDGKNYTVWVREVRNLNSRY